MSTLLKTLRHGLFFLFLTVIFQSSIAHSIASPVPEAEDLRTQARDLVRKATRADLLEAAKKLQSGLNLPGRNTARDYLALGEIYMKLSRFPMARKMFSQAMNADPDDIELQCLALSDLADLDSTLGHQAESLANSAKALIRADLGASDRVKARILESGALALLYNPDPAGALDRLRSAGALLTPKDIEETGNYLLYSAFGHLRANKTLAALDETLHALEIWKKDGDIYGVARANSALGLLWTTLGEPTKARIALNAAMAAFRRIGDIENQAVSLNSLGLLSQINGDHRRSLDYFHRARALFVRLDDPVGEIGAMNGEAAAYRSMRQFRAAESLYLSASRRVWKEKSEIQQSVALLNLGDIYAATDRPQIAEVTYRKALSLCQARNEEMTESEALFHLGAFLKNQRRYEEAITFLDRARNLSNMAGRPDKVAEAHFELAGIHRSMKQPDIARREIESAIRTIEAQRSKHDESESRAFYFLSVHRYYQLYIDVLMDLYREKGGDYAVRAFEASEKSKARSLLDVVEQAARDGNCHPPSLDAMTADAKAGSGNTTGKAGPSGPCDAQPLGLREIQEAIRGDNAILLEYAWGSDKKHGYLWVVDESGFAVEELSDFSRLESPAKRILDAMTARIRREGESALANSARFNRAQKNYRHDAPILARELWGRVSGRLAHKRMIIVPDGALPDLPYSALLAGLPRSAAPDSVVTLPSASLLGLIRKEAETRPRPSALAAIFANPVYNRGDRIHAAGPNRDLSQKPAPALAKVFKDLGLRAESVPDLQNDEAQYIAEVFPGEEILSETGFRASRDTVLRTDLTRYRYLHFSVHGLLDTRYPEFSGLLLSLFNEKGEPRNGYLSISEIYKLPLAADVVVLSACDSALGKDMKSEGMIALPRAFLSAGARSVLSTLWKVNEEATAKLMKRFYIHLREGRAPDVALQLAQAEIRGIPQWRDPYYWAGFIFQGDYRSPVR